MDVDFNTPGDRTDCAQCVVSSAVKRSIGSTTGCTITEKAPTSEPNFTLRDSGVNARLA